MLDFDFTRSLLDPLLNPLLDPLFDPFLIPFGVEFSKIILNGFDNACFRAAPKIQAITSTSTNMKCLTVPQFVIRVMRGGKMFVEK